MPIDESLRRRLHTALHCPDPKLWLYVVRELAKGEPVKILSISAALGLPSPDAESALKTFKDIVYDHDGSIVACGLSLIPTPHSFRIEGHNLYAWCALDTLMYPLALRQAARVSSRCPVTGHAVRLCVSPTGVSSLSPEEAVICMSIPEGDGGCCSMRNSFCSQVNFMISDKAADAWRSTHPDALILSIGEAWELGRHFMQQRLAHEQTPGSENRSV